MKPPKVYEFGSCFIELQPGGQKARAWRLEIRSADGKSVIQSAAEAKFETKVVGDASICAQEQAHLWARELPAVIDNATDKRQGDKQ